VFRERADRTLQDPGDVAYFMGVQELGVIPVEDKLDVHRSRNGSGVFPPVNGSVSLSVPVNNRVELISWRHKTSLMAESYRTTLTSILFSSRSGERTQVLVCTSASPREGKTTTVCNLGIALAEINHSVLLIDADMRRPHLHDVFDVDNRRGLGDLLLEKTPLDASVLEAACLPTCVPGLFVLPSGGSRHSVSSLLHSARLPELVALARTKFDSIVVDTPPMVDLADARVVARYGDGLILVVRSGVTTRDAARFAKARFVEDGISILGTILNGWNPKSAGHGYYRYYYAGYHHYYADSNGTEPDERLSESDAPATAPRVGSPTPPPRIGDGRAARQRDI
jgi:polysaccharide biosynthesis transport protein